MVAYFLHFYLPRNIFKLRTISNLNKYVINFNVRILYTFMQHRVGKVQQRMYLGSLIKSEGTKSNPNKFDIVSD